ncbi:hypothetical protein [Pedobacter sp. UYP30]|uniref:hypothetical protein n=1 Tax=Pedobacter sp. UYP30 TaxID=1756400 RepID=UPI00339291F7
MKIYINKGFFNDFDTIRTVKDGAFFVDGMSVENYKDLHLQREVPFNFNFEKQGYKKLSLDVRKFKKNENPNGLDTMDFCKIYLEKIP